MPNTPPNPTTIDWESVAKQIIRQTHAKTDATVQWLAHTHHRVFYAEHERKSFVLKLTRFNTNLLRRWKAQTDIRKRMVTQPAVRVPKPIAIGVAARRRVLYSFDQHIPGEARTHDTVTVDEVVQIGRFLADLHNVTDRERGYDSEALPLLDHNGLFGSGVYDPGADNETIFDEHQQQTLRAIAERVQQLIAATETPDYGIVHGDLLLHNALFDDRGRLGVLDWEYCGYGYRLYDLTPLLWNLKPHPQYAAFEDALWSAYTEMRRGEHQYQREHLETWIAARQVASLRWVAANQDNPHLRGHVAAIVEARTTELNNFLETGTLSRS